MTATVAYETASRLAPSREFSNDDATKDRVDFGLRRSLASEAATDELYDDLETVLGEDAVRPSPSEGAAIADRLRKVTPTLEIVVKRLIEPYPEDQMRYVVSLSAEHPGLDDAHGHLVRFASSILTVLDLMGDTAS